MTDGMKKIVILILKVMAMTMKSINNNNRQTTAANGQ
jgi:hypothetical protein